MTSREIAELTGKDLSHIHRDTRAMLDELAESDDPDLDHVCEEKDSRGYTTCFHLPKGLTFTLMAGYSVKMRHAIIRRWQELEAQAAAPVMALPQDYIQALESLHASVIAVEGKTKRRNFYNWRLLKNYCTANELDVGKSFNPGIQKDVNTYPAAAWFDVYGVVLGELFCEVAA